MRPFRCPVTILNTLDHLGKFDGKADEGFFVGYSMNSKAFRVFNSRTRIVEETLHITFLENKPNVAGSGPSWLFDIDTLIKSMNYKPIVKGNQSNGSAGTKACDNAGEKKDAKVLEKESGVSSKEDDQDDQDLRDEFERLIHQEKDENVSSTNNMNTVSSTVNTASINDNAVDENIVYGCEDDPNMPNLEEIVYSDDDKDVGAEADMTNLDTHIPVSLIPTAIIHKDHPVKPIIGDIHSAPQTRSMTKHVTNHVEPNKAIQALTDPIWIERAIRAKWVYRNKKDERGIVVRNKARLVAQGYTQEVGIYYDEVFGPVAKIEAIRLFLAFASFKDFFVYQMDVKSAFLYGKIEKEVYVCQPLGFEDPEFPDRVYKVEKLLYGLHQAPRAWKEMCTEFEKMMHKKFQINSMGELTFFLGLQVTQKDDGIFISQDKYVDEILKKFGFSTVKTASTPMETSKPLMKDDNAKDVDVHLYRSMIGSLMYLTSSRPDIMFVVCACARFQVTPKVSHLHAVKRIFRYLKGQPKLGLWYPKDSPFDLEAYTDSDYASTSLDRKSTTGAEYVAASNCCGQVLWIQNQMLDYGYNFMNTKIFFDNESTSCIVKNPVFHTKTKHIEIRHHFIRDSYEKILIQVIKIHTDHNIADLLTKAFDVSRFRFLTARLLALECQIFEICLNCNPTIYVSYIEQFWSTAKIKTVNNETQIRGKGDGKTIVITESSVRRDLHFDDEDADETIHKERGDSVERDATAATSLDAEQCRIGNYYSKEESQEVGKEEKVKNSITQEEGRNEIDQDEGISWFQEDSETQGSAPITTTGVSVSTAKPSTPPTTTTTTTVIEDEDLTIAQTLMKMKSEKSKKKRVVRGVVMQECSESRIRTRVPPSQIDPKDKGKAKMVEPENPLKKKDQIKFDEELAHILSTPDLMARALDHLSNCELPLVSLRVATSKVKTSVSKPKSLSEPLIEDWISDSENENETESKSRQRKHSNVKVEFVKSNEHVKSPRESVKKVENNKQAKYPRKNSQSPKDCDFYEKKMVEKPVWNNARRVNHQNSQRMSHPHPKGNFVPKAVLMKSSLKTLNTARQNSSRSPVSVNTAKPINTAYPRPTVNSAKPASNVFNRAHSHVRRPFNKFTTNKNINFNDKVNTIRGNVTTVGPKAIGNPQFELQEKGVIDSGCSRHMTENMSYLFDYEEIDGGYVVAFGENPKGGKITGKGKISTDTECVVLSLDFKLLDESQVLFKVPRKNNMYSVDLKNVAPSGGLTCLFAKAT
ncbi:putative ribonuclease H-like domain-containing protein [Tanacetum coccineum]